MYQFEENKNKNFETREYGYLRYTISFLKKKRCKFNESNLYVYNTTGNINIKVPNNCEPGNYLKNTDKGIDPYGFFS
jgi:hypothetical protein